MVLGLGVGGNGCLLVGEANTEESEVARTTTEENKEYFIATRKKLN